MDVFEAIHTRASVRSLKHLRLLAVLPIGKSAVSPHQARKKTLAEIVYYKNCGKREKP